MCFHISHQIDMVVISVESVQILKLYNAVTRIENMMKNNSFWISFSTKH